MNRNKPAPKKAAPKLKKTTAPKEAESKEQTQAPGENQLVIDASRSILIVTKEKEFFPQRGSAGAALLDLKSTEKRTIKAGDAVKLPTGVKTLFPKQFIGKVYARSSMFDHGLMLANGVGIIDPDYRGEIMMNYFNFTSKDVVVEKGASIGQLSFELNTIRVISEDKFYRRENTEVKGIYSEEMFTDFEAKFPTKRGSGGFGSTDKTE